MAAPGHNASLYCDIGGGPTLPVTQLSQASPTPLRIGYYVLSKGVGQYR